MFTYLFRLISNYRNRSLRKKVLGYILSRDQIRHNFRGLDID